MSPDATAPALPCAPRTVAMRKEANELRKSLKPLLEKRRRARINASLGRLQALILPLTGRENCRYSKLEKADVLEMTVRFLTDVPSKDSTDGYKTCLQRASAFLPQTRLDAEQRRCVNAFIQRSVTRAQPACCCAHGPTFVSQIQQKLLELKSSQSRIPSPKKSDAALLTRPAPPALMRTDAGVWRPW